MQSRYTILFYQVLNTDFTELLFHYMSFLDKLYLGTHEEVIHDIFALYHEEGNVFVNYLYFANVMHHRLLEDPKEEVAKKYLQALEVSDFLLIDGIALQLFYYMDKGCKKKYMAENLNGTDLYPSIMEKLHDLQGKGKKVHLAWYSVYDPLIEKDKGEALKAKVWVEEKWGLEVNFLSQSLYAQRGEDFDWIGYEQSLKEEDYDIHVFCSFLGTPFQEIRAEEYRDFFEDNKILVLNQGGTIDFLSGFEKRAPKWVVKSRVLETFRRILSNPKKNLKKFMWMFGIVRYWWFSLIGIFYQKSSKSSGK